MSLNGKPGSVPWILVVVLLLFAGGLTAAGILYYREQGDYIRRQAEGSLADIADGKVDQVANWRRERLSDADAILHDGMAAAHTRRFLATGTPAFREDLLSWMRSLQQHQEYRDVVLLDPQGVVRLSVGAAGGAMGPYARRMFRDAVRTRRPMLSDLHRAAVVDGIHLDMHVPLLAGTGSRAPVVAVLFVRIDPSVRLYPVIQEWPVSSRTAETLIVRREDGDALFLNELRHREDTALSLRIPLTRLDIPSVRGVLGYEGTSEGNDYRGVRVLAAVRRIPDTPWVMVAKVDAEEVFGPIRERGWIAAIMVGGLLLAAAASVALLWRRHDAEAMRRQMEAERQRRILAQRYEYLTKNANDIVLLMDEEARILDVNERALTSYGYSRERLLGMGVWELRAPEAPMPLEDVKARMRERGGVVFESVHRRADGSTFPVEISGRSLEIDGQVLYQGLVRDITKRRRAEDAVRFQANLLDAVEQAVVATDPDGRITYANRFGEHLFGWSRAEARVLYSQEMAGSPEAGRAIAEIRRRLAEGRGWSGEVLARRQDGTTLTVYGTISPLFDAQGVRIGAVTVCTDVTERRRLEERMQHAQKLESLAVLAGGVAHDFNNLLAGILGHAELALMKLPPESPACHNLAQVETAAQRAAELTAQMLAYSGKGKFVVQPLHLSRLVEEMTHLLETVISKKATLRLSFAPNVAPVEGDPTQMRQVIMNLITNASEAIGERSGIISISTGMVHADQEYLATTCLQEDLPEGYYVTLEVSDTGVGMDADTQARIFDPFFTTKFTGRGLGLAAVIGIVRGHRGAIKVYSEPGRGTCFKVLLPSAGNAVAEAAAPEQKSAPWRADGTVLVVDDEETVRTVARVTLESAGFIVHVARDGIEGVSLLEKHPEQTVLVLLDMTMPRMDGEETFRAMRRVCPDVRVVLSSGYGEEDAMSRFAGKGLAGFIQKPYRPAALIRKVRSVLEPGTGPSGSQTHGVRSA